MLPHAAPRSLSLAVFALALLNPRASAQHSRTDVRRFQWDPVVVHVAAEASLGVEIYMSVQTRHWGLTWILPDTLTAWIPQLHAIMSTTAASDSTAWVGARGDSRLRVIKGVVQGRSAFALQLSAPPSHVRIEAWLPPAYLADFSKSLEKAILAAHDLDHAPALANAQPVYEEWDVDSIPGGENGGHGFYMPDYLMRVTTVVGFVVDSTGRVAPSSVTVYDCDDPNFAKQWQREVASWKFVPGVRGDHHVATRVREGFAIENSVSVQVNNMRVIPGKP